MTTLARLRARNEFVFAGVLPRAGRGLAAGWWIVLVLRGVLPAAFAIAMGVLVGAVQRGEPLGVPLALVAAIFIPLQVLPPIHRALGANLGSRTASWLNDQLTQACVRPPGIGHLEDPALTGDLTVSRDFDLGMTGPPMFVSMDFISAGLVEMIAGVTSAFVLFGYTWWAPLVLLIAWLATHWLLRESAVWRDRNTSDVREAQRHADYFYRLAVDPPASKELRLFGLAAWTVERFRARRRQLFDLQWHATRLRERPVLWSLLIVVSANAFVFWSMASNAFDGLLPLNRVITFATAAVTTSAVAFGGFSWALDGTAAPVAAVTRLTEVMSPRAPRSPTLGTKPVPSVPGTEIATPVPGTESREPVPGTASGELVPGTVSAAGHPAREIRFRDVTFAYPSGGDAILKHFDLTIPAGSSLAIVGRNGAGKTTLAKLLCRLYDPQFGAIEIDGIDLRQLEIASWRRRLTAVFQDFIKFELSLRENVAPAGAPDTVIVNALAKAGATGLADLDTVLARGYAGGTDLSGGQWQRVALARTLCAVELGAGVVLLDEPTAQLDVRGEAEIFDRILSATRHTTTILISHRFSTVRHADRICVLEDGQVVELGTHDELMAAKGRYHTMFELQASRFAEGGEPSETEGTDVLE
jgi:ABC-type multidrug transport system fused ATPase/permease subunit